MYTYSQEVINTLQDTILIADCAGLATIADRLTDCVTALTQNEHTTIQERTAFVNTLKSAASLFRLHYLRTMEANVTPEVLEKADGLEYNTLPALRVALGIQQ